jgi:hypothetical protein
VKSKSYLLVICLFSTATVISGCLSLGRPSTDLASKVPVVEVGKEKPPETGKYIVFLPAGKEVSIEFSLRGSFLAQEGSTEMKIRLARDLYLYEGSGLWGSLDGKKWEHLGKLIDFDMKGKLELQSVKVDVRFDEDRRLKAQQHTSPGSEH